MKGKYIMASFHLSIKSGKRGKASEHAAYIAREGKYGKEEKKEDLVVVEHGNLPEWANGNPSTFWKAADDYERANGAAYKEYELALPSELTNDQQLELAREFVKQQIGVKPFQMAIHAPIAALGAVKQPHAHVMFSDRKPDGIARSPKQLFKRFNPAHPELGGCKKDSGGKDPATLKSDLKTRRANFADLQNQILEKYGHSARVDSRSYRERGIEKEPEKHLGAAAIKQMDEEDKAQIKDRRQKAKKQNA
jgi:hypothetical protein